MHRIDYFKYGEELHSYLMANIETMEPRTIIRFTSELTRLHNVCNAFQSGLFEKRDGEMQHKIVGTTKKSKFR